MYVFSLYTIISLVAGFFPLYFSVIGFSNVQIGFIYSIGPLVSIFSNLLWGIISDKYRTIKKVLLILLIGQLIMTLLLTQTTSFAVICVMMIVFNFFYFPLNPLADTLAIMTMQERGKNFMTVRIFGSLGFAVSSLVIGFILKQNGAHITLWVCLILTGMAMIIALFLTDKSGSVKKMEFGGLLEVLKKREVIWFFIFVLFVAVAHRFNDAFLSPVLRQMGANENTVGWALADSSISEMPVFFLLSRYGSNLKELPLLAIASFMYGIRFLLMSLVTDPTWVIAIQAMHSVSFGIYYFTAICYVTQIIPEEYRATGLALFTIVWSSIAGLISGTLGGSLLDINKEVFYMMAMALAFIGSIGFMTRHLVSKNA
jgi:PPP family 3-phenylpropionic acid transporter